MIKYVLLLTTALTLSACTSSSLFESWEEEEPNTADTVIPNGSFYKVEKPYEINGVWYFPAENYDYSEKGLASWYMPANGRAAKTANGEEYIATEMTARHKTLPLPSIVKITNLENNKSIIARVNDRGPMVNNRLIDVSQKAAQELGFPVTGTTSVMVEVMPKESQEIRDALLASGRVYTEDGATQELSVVPPMPVPVEEAPAVEVAPAPVYTPAEPVYTTKTKKVVISGGTGNVYIQLGAYGDPANASKVQRAVSAVTQVETGTKASGGRTLTVVKAGPYADKAEAEQVLRQLKQMGYRDAYIAK
ncbi:MAG: septal ring lytic transglycosylase RlpA family protein [Alphaproteobacteria bacterium]|nr:septal ring lytic transglycosylase RlpA family protein [Alphaproteobacteria bacterium]